MAEIVTFLPAPDVGAQTNLDAFVDVCRCRVTVFGRDLPFDEDVWDITHVVDTGAKHSSNRLVFSTLETCDTDAPQMMAATFKAFAKSYMRYQHGLRKTTAVVGRMTALRLVESALREVTGTSDPTQINPQVLDRACQMAKARYVAAGAYRAGLQIQLLWELMQRNRLARSRATWRNSLKRPVGGQRVGKEFDRQREKLMPSEAALRALPKIFDMAVEPADVLVSSLVAMFCCAPERYTETLLLPNACEVRESRSDNGEPAYGWRWWPRKGAKPQVKWIPSSMQNVATLAVARIRALTEEARSVARWYEQHPGQIYLPETLSHLRGQEYLNMEEVTAVVFADSAPHTAGYNWCHYNRLPLTPGAKNHTRVRFDDVERTVLAKLPRGFPFIDPARKLRYSDALCVIQTNTLDTTSGRLRCVIEPVKHPHIHNRLGARSTSGVKSIFDRCGMVEPDGCPIRTSTKQFRHWLNTLAQTGGASQLDIALWSGRKDVRQNEVYDHESNENILARIRASVGEDSPSLGSLAIVPRKTMIARIEFGNLKVPTAHTTDFGYCIHDYVMSPCQLHRDCINCDEDICVKGDKVRNASVRQALAESNRLREDAARAVARGDKGAAAWLDHHALTHSRLTKLVDIFDDPAVPPGSVIQLAITNTPSRIEQAGRRRRALAGDESGATTDVIPAVASPSVKKLA